MKLFKAAGTPIYEEIHREKFGPCCILKNAYISAVLQAI